MICELLQQLDEGVLKRSSPAALKAQRDVNLIQYLVMMLKRFGHAEELKGYVSLPGSKQMKLEGFSEVFVVPMIISSFAKFASASNFFWQLFTSKFKNRDSPKLGPKF